MTTDFRIRIIEPSEAEIELIAERMLETLVEVLGKEEGGAIHTMEDVIQRVRWHLDPDAVCAQIFVAENGDQENVGHTIVRIDKDDDGEAIGLFATTYILPKVRRSGLAIRLLKRGEEWMLTQGMSVAATYTDKHNTKLHKLYLGQGYQMSPMPKSFVKLSKPLSKT
jgi:GNAT superfamily N-acetyltransferase